MIAKRHQADGKVLLALCDGELFGQKIEDNNARLDLSSRFYAGEEVTDEEAIHLLREAYMVNAVGEKTVGFLLAKGIIDQTMIVKVKNIPYCQALLK